MHESYRIEAMNPRSKIHIHNLFFNFRELDYLFLWQPMLERNQLCL